MCQVVGSSYGWSRVTSWPLTNAPQELTDALAECSHCRYSDRRKNLTALKDMNMASCFITDLDEQWMLYPEDKLYITQTEPCDIINTGDDFSKLKTKAGSTIAEMCKSYFIFWLNMDILPPPMVNDPRLPSKPPEICPFAKGPPRLTEIKPPFATEPTTIENKGGKYDDGHATKVSSAPGVKPSMAAVPLVPGSFPAGNMSPPVTDADGLRVPPFASNVEENHSNNVYEPPMVSNRNSGSTAKDNSDLIAPPLMVTSGDLVAPPLMPEGTTKSDISVRDNGLPPPLPVREAVGNGYVDTGNAETPPPQRALFPLLTRIGNQEMNGNNFDYPVPEMGSMDTPPPPPGLMELFQIGYDSPYKAMEDMPSPPPPDMRTPPLPQDWNRT